MDFKKTKEQMKTENGEVQTHKIKMIGLHVNVERNNIYYIKFTLKHNSIGNCCRQSKDHPSFAINFIVNSFVVLEGSLQFIPRRSNQCQ